MGRMDFFLGFGSWGEMCGDGLNRDKEEYGLIIIGYI